MPKFIPSNIDFIVCSGGGAGTTMLLDYFSQRHRVNSPKDYDNLKHLPIPPVSFNKNMKCIFVYSNPVDVCISLFNRGYQFWQSRKMSRFSKSENIIPQDLTLKDYADNGQDLFGMEDQFNSYYENHILYPTLFLKYEAIWENLEIIKKFLSLTDEEMSCFPPRRPRNSTNSNCPTIVYEKLDKKIYNCFKKRMELLPSAVIREPQKYAHFLRVLSSKNFRLALKNGFSSMIGRRSLVYGE